jgi:hypothetical protein
MPKRKAVLICGDGPTLEEDLSAWGALGISADEVCCLNRAVTRCTLPVDKLFSVHPEFLTELRDTHGLTCELWSTHKHNGVRHVSSGSGAPCGGSSALIAVSVALRHWGAQKVVLAGVPLSGPYERFHHAWKLAYRELYPTVRGMSGFTASLLGTPDTAWLRR